MFNFITDKFKKKSHNLQFKETYSKQKEANTLPSNFHAINSPSEVFSLKREKSGIRDRKIADTNLHLEENKTRLEDNNFSLVSLNDGKLYTHGYNHIETLVASIDLSVNYFSYSLNRPDSINEPLMGISRSLTSVGLPSLTKMTLEELIVSVTTYSVGELTITTPNNEKISSLVDIGLLEPIDGTRFKIKDYDDIFYPELKKISNTKLKVIPVVDIEKYPVSYLKQNKLVNILRTSVYHLDNESNSKKERNKKSKAKQILSALSGETYYHHVDEYIPEYRMSHNNIKEIIVFLNVVMESLKEFNKPYLKDFQLDTITKLLKDYSLQADTFKVYYKLIESAESIRGVSDGVLDKYLTKLEETEDELLSFKNRYMEEMGLLNSKIEKYKSDYTDSKLLKILDSLEE